ncbi:MAG: hypothetical protein K9M55_00445 [Candidatus Marinimicrobia bacterium]|nr:hypothetical protein [Candidatus Neomarinimicrobiota bacterium]MCF7921146.1 hypothetical protein [Candidatus Neomarinimicrobiota bacterium]
MKRVNLLALFIPMALWASPAVLSDRLYDEDNWLTVESRTDGISVAEKKIDGISVRAVKVSQVIAIDPETLAQVIEDLTNYGQFLKSAPGMECQLLENNTDHLVGYQYVDIPLISDRVYAFKMFRPEPSGTRVDWELIPQNNLGDYKINKRSGVYIDVGVGSWSMNKQADGKYHVSYRLVMDPGGWIPDSVSDYFNRVSIVGIFKDALIETERRSAEGKS